MENIWNEAQEKIHNGSTFRVDLEKRDLLIDGKYIIKEGKYEGNLGYDTKFPVNDILSMVEEYYWQYSHSVPSARSEAKCKRYFRALPEHELSENDMLYGESRELSQLRLELYILIAILNGNLNWDDFAKDKWFWQSKVHPSLILLKQWIVINNK
ncbi:hypothetical protein [Bacteroides thetaiotaomicron]|uniref:hypothetical protein n=1 Tax=Bacteroides thetaiotaomicron TaxID=818 RepID=UPI0039C39008